jgi:hypothetical protein
VLRGEVLAGACMVMKLAVQEEENALSRVTWRWAGR